VIVLVKFLAKLHLDLFFERVFREARIGRDQLRPGNRIGVSPGTALEADVDGRLACLLKPIVAGSHLFARGITRICCRFDDPVDECLNVGRRVGASGSGSRHIRSPSPASWSGAR
jgi:hypothetical protein